MTAESKTPGAALHGQCVMIVEDELLIAMELRAMLERHGCVILGPVNTVDRALAVLDRQTPDVVCLDVNLNGQMSTPVAAALTARDVPFVIVTGYGAACSDDIDLQSAPRVEKPVIEERLLTALEAELQRA